MAAKPERRTVIDPAVAELLGDLVSKQHLRRLPVKERQKRAKEKAKAQTRNRIMLDLPEDIQTKLFSAANSLGCPMSQVAAALLILGLSELEVGRVNLSAYRKPSKSPRYAFVIELDEFRNFVSQGTPLTENRDTPIGHP